MAVYDFDDYKVFVNDVLKTAQGNAPTRKDLATALSCQPSHISAVLSGDAHLSAEQAERVAHFFKLNSAQTEYFLLLVHANRAGTPRLRAIYEDMLRKLKEKATSLKSKLDIVDELSEADQAKHYSSWIYACVHVMLSVPQLQMPQAIAERLRLSLSQVEDALQFLVSVGMAEKVTPTCFRQKRSLLHLDRSSVFVTRHHTNWRLKALQAIEENRDDSLHYSGVVSLSTQDLAQVRRVLSEALRSSINIAKISTEEEVAGLCLDFFRL